MKLLCRNIRCLAVVLGLLMVPGMALAAGSTFEAKVTAMVDAGQITAEDALLYKFHYIYDQNRLPADLRPDSFQPLKNSTEIVWSYQMNRMDYSTAAREVIDGYLAPRAYDKATYISGAGNFRFTYSTGGADAVPATDTTPANGIPDFVERNAEYMEYSWLVEITNMGFSAPPKSPYYEVDFEALAGAYGVTQSLGGANTKITLHNNFLGFPPNDDPDGDQLGAAKVTCAHEFKHASQMAQSGWSEGGWVELDATWMEDIVYDVVNDYYNYIGAPGSPITAPTTSMDSGGTGSYEDCIWQLWMSETYGEQIIIDFWDRRETNTIENTLTTYDVILQNYGTSYAKGFPVFAAWNYATGSRALPGYGYGEAPDYPQGPVTNVNTYPFVNYQNIADQAAFFYHCTGFTGDPGTFDIDFNGQNSRKIGLIAVIKKTDGTAVVDSLELSLANDIVTSLSVPLEDIASVGVVVSNSRTTGAADWTITLNANVMIPEPTADLSAASVAKSMPTNSTATEYLDVSNNGDSGSTLELTVADRAGVPAKALAAMAPVRSNMIVRERETAGPVMPFQGQVQGLQEKYAGDCVLGNDDTANILGSYTSWWTGNESYASLISPSTEGCGCGVGFNVRSIHMVVGAVSTSAPMVRVHLAESTGGACPAPGAIIDTSAPVTFSAFPDTGLYDLEIPADFACSDMSEDYFLIVEFMDANGPVWITVDTTPQSCVNYNEWDVTGYQELVDGYSFQGDLLIWADVDCCGVALPTIEVNSPDGGEYLAIGEAVDLTWGATILTDVKLELSRDNGGSWETLFASTPNDGIESWVVTGPESAQCLLRASSLDDLYTDTSDAAFVIYTPIPWLTVSPDMGSVPEGGTLQLALDFDSTGLTPGVYNGYLEIVHNAAGSPDQVPVTLTVTGGIADAGDTPAVFGLEGNYPNPFNPSTTVRFSLDKAGPATVAVYDLQGKLIRTLFQGDLEVGSQTVNWDGNDARGQRAGSGIYFVRVVSGENIAQHKMTLVK